MTTTTRPPRKYLDPDRTEINPAWPAWRAEQMKGGVDAALAAGIDPAVYFPEEFDKAIPKDGQWILVLEEPFTELRSRYRVPLLSMWRARPHTLNGGAIRVGAVTARPQQAVIGTPGGELHLWPHEYQTVTDPYTLMSCEGAVIHNLGGEPVLDEEMLFYLQSRGIPYPDAVLLLIEQVKNTNYVYVTFPEDVTAALEGVGQPLWRHIQRNPRSPS